MKTIFLAVLLTLSIRIGYTQCVLPYEPLPCFDNDTTSFITYNFKDRSDCYKDKAFSLFANDLDVDIKDFIVIGSMTDANASIGIYVYIYSEQEVVKRRIKCQASNIIEIIWNREIPEGEIYSIKQSLKDKGWNDTLSDYFMHRIIKSVYVLNN